VKLNLNLIERNQVMPKIERKIGVEGAEATDCKVRTEGNKVDLKEENLEDVEEGEVPEDLT
jgi:hypothetical protein